MKLQDKHFELSETGREEVLGKVCVELGFCSLGDTYDFLLDNPPSRISEFVDVIIVAEGHNRDSTPLRWKRRMRDMILEAVEKHGGRVW